MKNILFISRIPSSKDRFNHQMAQKAESLLEGKC